MSDVLSIELEASPELSFAMVENAVPLIARLSLTNNGAAALNNVTVEAALLPDFSAKWSAHVTAIPAGGTFNVAELELPLDRNKLVNQLERGGADLSVWVRSEGTALPLASLVKHVDVLAYNEWSPLTSPQLLAAFVLPNHPAIAELLGEARAPLQRLSGNPSFDAYQSGETRRVALIAQAIYETIQARGITYSNPPASFERIGQKIRTPEQALGEQLATCLDVAVLVAACLEQTGLHPVTILVEGHAFPGVWLEDFYTPEAVIDEGSTLRKLVELDRLLIFDSSAAVSRPLVPFAEARRIAAKTLETVKLIYAVDIKGARKQRYRPLPVRVVGQYAAAVEIRGSDPQPESARPAIVPGSGQGTRQRSQSKTKHPRIEAWKQRLLDTSLRNKLLNFKDTKLTLDLLCAELGPVEDILALGGELKLRGRPPAFGGDDLRSKKLLEAREHGDAAKVFLRDRLDHGELYSDHSADATTTKLTAIYRGAREALEETGTNTLCLTFGMLQWYESETSEKPRRAPILIVPVVLERSARSNTFTLRATGEEERLNVTLFEKLRLDRGITVPELAELPTDQAGIDVPAVLRIAREAVLNVPRWEVKDELHLGLFSFAKFQMWADLEQNSDALLENPAIAHLLNGKGDAYPNAGPFPEPSELDAKMSPKDLLCPMDADASQLAAVAAAAEGKTFILQGPPGTGKSQTITNLITHCIAQGKRVLFVAEKAAALEVVQRRLKQVGLAPYVLELHSHKSGKQQVLQQFQDALDEHPCGEPPGWDLTTEKLADQKLALNNYVAALHKPRAGGITIYQAIARLDRLRDAAPHEVPAACTETPAQLDRLRGEVESLRRALVSLSPIQGCAWQGCQFAAWEVDLPSRVAAAIDQSVARLDGCRLVATELASCLGAGTPTTIADLDSLCTVATLLEQAPPHGDALRNPQAWKAVEPEARALSVAVRTRADALMSLRTRYDDGLFGIDLDAVAERFQRLARAFFLFAWWGLRAARKTLRAVARGGRLAGRQQVAQDLEQAREARALGERIAGEDARGREIFGPSWGAVESDPAALEAAVTWAAKLRQAIDAVRPGLLGGRLERQPDLAGISADGRAQVDGLRASLEQLLQMLGMQMTAEAQSRDDLPTWRGRLLRWRASLGQLREWSAYLTASRTLSQAGCGALVAAAAAGQLSPEGLSPSFEKGAYQAWLRKALPQEPILNAFDGEQHQRRVTAFADLDRALLSESKGVARAALSRRIPQPGTAATGGEMGTLQKELQKKRKLMPIRKLLAEIPSLAARLKPCFLMSPMSVATYLDPRAPGFDVVVFDEASQIPTHDAVGVLGRGRSAVVVGDSKQLPPTVFFQSGGDDEAPEDGEFEELESILNECLAAGFPERRLDWHYRSRHESLIAFSNFHYYKNRLNTFPSSSQIGPGRGVTLRQVSGFYDKGASATNLAEARALIADLVARLRSPEAKNHSYGVVTFSQAQQKLIEDLLDHARAESPQIESFFGTDCAEPIIVKNLENIQGDERDVMLFSICYGPDQNGKVSMNFGPLNREGGERRLNVAVTRAREELVVYSTLTPEQIDLTRTKAVGVKHLKTFLDYARRGPIAISEALTVQNADQFDSPFEEEVCERLRALGFTVHTQVGCAGYRIDMAICHPDEEGRYVLALECDGAHYHSARSARERDRLRGQVLEGLGWRIHRIWSTDWWQSPQRELERVQAAIESAKVELNREPRPLAPPDVTLLPLPESAAAGSKPTGRPAMRRDAPPPFVAPVPVVNAPLLARAAVSAQAVVPYLIAAIPEGRRGPDDVHGESLRKELVALLHDVINVEAPLSLRVLARRVCPYFGVQRTTGRFEDRLRAVLGRTVKIQDDVLWRLDQDPATYSEVRLASADARREAQEVPLEEVANAAISILRSNIAVSHDELVKLTARMLGFARTGERVAEHMALAVALLVKRGSARREGDKLVLSC